MLTAHTADMMEVRPILGIIGLALVVIAAGSGRFFEIRRIRRLELSDEWRVGLLITGLLVLCGVLFIPGSLSEFPHLPPPGSHEEKTPSPDSPREAAIYIDDQVATSPDKIKVFGITATSQHDPPRVNDRITIQFSLQNIGQQPVALESTFIGARDPEKQNKDFSAENRRKILKPSEIANIKGSIAVSKKGVWKFWPCYTIGSGYCPNEWQSFSKDVVEHP